MPWEVKTTVRGLMNVIHSEAVGHELDKLHKEKCCGSIVEFRFNADTNASYTVQRGRRTKDNAPGRRH